MLLLADWAALAAVSWPGDTSRGSSADVGWVVELRQSGLAGDGDVGRPHPGRRDREERDQHHRLGHVGGDDASSEVPAVDQTAAERAEGGGHDELAHEQRRRRGAGAGLGEHVHRQGDDAAPSPRCR